MPCKAVKGFKSESAFPTRPLPHKWLCLACWHCRLDQIDDAMRKKNCHALDCVFNKRLNKHIYIYIYIYSCVFTYIYMYIYNNMRRLDVNVYVHVFMYIYIQDENGHMKLCK